MTGMLRCGVAEWYRRSQNVGRLKISFPSAEIVVVILRSENP